MGKAKQKSLALDCHKNLLLILHFVLAFSMNFPQPTHAQGFYSTQQPGANCIYDWLNGGYWCDGSGSFCDPGFYPSGNICIRNGYKACPGYQHTCPSDKECTFAGCVPEGLAEYQLCPDGLQYCSKPGFMCVPGTSFDSYSCRERAQVLRENEQREEEMRKARRRAFAAWAVEGGLIAAQAGVDVLSSAATDLLAPGWGGYYKGGIQSVTDVGIGEKTWDQAALDYTASSAASYAGLSTPATVYRYYKEYSSWWAAIPR